MGTRKRFIYRDKSTRIRLCVSVYTHIWIRYILKVKKLNYVFYRTRKIRKRLFQIDIRFVCTLLANSFLFATDIFRKESLSR